MTRVYSVAQGASRRFFATSAEARRSAELIARESMSGTVVTVRRHQARTHVARHMLVEWLHGAVFTTRTGQARPLPKLDDGIVLVSLVPNVAHVIGR
jgi:hypothetical protein